ncbi:MAG TPA: hypothetical protein VF995_06755 [Actinomycetota bacterium]
MLEPLRALAPALLVATVLRAAAPLQLAVLGAVISQRAAVLNLALEGAMALGAAAGAWVAVGHGPLAGLLAGVVAGGAVGALQAVAVIGLRVDQLATGIALDLLALAAATGLAAHSRLAGNLGLAAPRHLPAAALALSVPGLGHGTLRIPAMALVAGALDLLTWLVLRFTPVGLRLRALAEEPEAAERAGVATGPLRAGALLAAGALAGLGGAALPLDGAAAGSGVALAGIAQGRGFVALAIALIAGRSLLAAALLCLPLGAAWPLPAGRGGAILWIALLLALALRIRRARMPRALNWRADPSA